MGVQLSQVFLRDQGWIRRCLARVEPAEFGVEWACGDGALTEELSHRWSSGLALDLDGSRLRELADRLDNDRWNVIRADLTEYPLPTRARRYPLVGNLPYHVTGPALMKILQASNRIRGFKGLVQWEVGERLAAEPGDSEYRSISLLYRRAGDIQCVFRVPADAFEPVPAVDSAWIEFEPDPEIDPSPPLAEFVRRCFRRPRKTLVNNLTDETDNKKHWRQWMETQDWDPRRRPQTLTPDELEVLYSAWTARNES